MTVSHPKPPQPHRPLLTVSPQPQMPASFCHLPSFKTSAASLILPSVMFPVTGSSYWPVLLELLHSPPCVGFFPFHFHLLGRGLFSFTSLLLIAASFNSLPFSCFRPFPPPPKPTGPPHSELPPFLPSRPVLPLHTRGLAAEPALAFQAFPELGSRIRPPE